ncbi:MAG: hypothetical protein ACO21V_07395, partial [Limnohabitans sp.]
MKAEPQQAAGCRLHLRAKARWVLPLLWGLCAPLAWAQTDQPQQPEAATGLVDQNSVRFARQGVSAA